MLRLLSRGRKVREANFTWYLMQTDALLWLPK